MKKLLPIICLLALPLGLSLTTAANANVNRNNAEPQLISSQGVGPQSPVTAGGEVKSPRQINSKSAVAFKGGKGTSLANAAKGMSLYCGKYHNLNTSTAPTSFTTYQNSFNWDEYTGSLQYGMGDPWNANDYATVIGEARAYSKAEIPCALSNFSYIYSGGRVTYTWYRSRDNKQLFSWYYDIPSPQSQGWEYWIWYSVCCWIGKFPHEINETGGYYCAVSSPWGSGTINVTITGTSLHQYQSGKYHNLTATTTPPSISPQQTQFNYADYPMGSSTNAYDYATVIGETVVNSRAEMLAVLTNYYYLADGGRVTMAWYKNGNPTAFYTYTYDVPSPSSQGYLYWIWYPVYSWVGKFPAEINAPGDYKVVITAPWQSKTITYKVIPAWTVMVYMNADCDLEMYGISDFDEMEVAASNNLNVIVQIDRAEGHDATNGDWKTCRRYKIKNDNTAGVINSTLIQEMGEQDMGNPQTLADFGKWAIQNYPAQKYSLIMWDHGNGWYKKGESEPAKGFSWDLSSGNNIDISSGEYASALSQIRTQLGRNLDHIGWNACLMGMWEVLDISRNYANVANVSEDIMSGSGFNYTSFLNAVNANPAMPATDLGISLTNGAVGNYTLSVVDLTQISNLDAKVNGLANELILAKDAGLTSSITTALAGALKFGASDGYTYHVDLSDFCTTINNAITSRPALTTAANNVKSAVTSAVKYTKNSSSPYDKAKGIAIYHCKVDVSNYNTNYNNLPSSASYKWDDYLQYERIAPSTAITSPANNSNVTGGSTVTIQASASDNVRVSKVEFYVNGVLKGTDNTSPYSYNWVVPSAKVTVYTLTTKAYDAAGNVTTSAPITVNAVANYPWTVKFDADQYPESASPAWTYSNPWGSTTRSLASGILTQNAPYNSCWYYTRNWGASNATGITILTRFNFVSTNEYFFLHVGNDAVYAYPGFTNTGGYKTYRLTLKNGQITCYTDENPTPSWSYAAQPFSGYNYIRWGTSGEGFFCGSGGTLYLDYFYYRTDGAFAPGVKDESIFDNAANVLPAQTGFSSAPNPITGRTTISYQVAAPGNVSLKIFNIQGQLIKTLVNGSKPAGKHSVLWDGKDEAGAKAAAGMYIYRMETKGYSATKKVTLLR